ncbi:MAG: outer membrane lipoprotein-sorting protein [Piscirickettsiaceae bacterium]|nr:MAG: outer membrane lipoprotein-sorting protein [Piscirickettsiaceae bacterium]
MIKSIVLSACLFIPLSALAISADEIAQRVDERDDGDKMMSTMEMTLIDKNGQQRVRTMKNFSMDREDSTHNVIFFLSPADVRNTAFLTYDYDESARDDDQWLYLPALQKTKRIASSDKSSSFMGSDFTYSDMTTRDISDYSYRIVKESTVRTHKVWIMESVPKAAKTIAETGYVKSYMFVRQDNYVVIRALHILQAKGQKKYLDVKKLDQIDGIWVATEIEMKTTQDKQLLHKTRLKLSDVKFNQALDADFFSIRRIEKGL